MNKQLRRTTPESAKSTKSQVDDMLSKIKIGDKIRIKYGMHDIELWHFRGFVDGLPIVKHGRTVYEVWNKQFLCDTLSRLTLTINHSVDRKNVTWSWSWQ